MWQQSRISFLCHLPDIFLAFNGRYIYQIRAWVILLHDALCVGLGERAASAFALEDTIERKPQALV